MSGTRAAIRYAKAVLELANSQGLAQQLNDDMVLIASTVKNNLELDTFFNNFSAISRDNEG